MIFKTNQNPKTRFTRMCITEAILELLESTPLEKMKVSSIVRRAGVSRMSFYKYYHVPMDALTDYMNILISGYLEEAAKDPKGSSFMEREHIVLALEYFDRYRNYFLALRRHGLYSIMIEAVNRFMEEHILTERNLSVYEMYSYAGGLLNTFLQWEERGRVESAEEIAAVISRRYHQQEA